MQTDLGRGTHHVNHVQNQLAYAQRIIAFMDQHIPRARVANMAVMNDASWHRIARLAGEEHMPSKATICMILGMVAMREAITDQGAKVTGPEGRLLSRLVPVDPEEGMI